MAFVIAFWKVNFSLAKLGKQLYFTSRRSPFWPIQTFQDTFCPALCESNNTNKFFKDFPVICSYRTIPKRETNSISFTFINKASSSMFGLPDFL